MWNVTCPLSTLGELGTFLSLEKPLKIGPLLPSMCVLRVRACVCVHVKCFDVFSFSPQVVRRLSGEWSFDCKQPDTISSICTCCKKKYHRTEMCFLSNVHFCTLSYISWQNAVVHVREREWDFPSGFLGTKQSVPMHSFSVGTFPCISIWSGHTKSSEHLISRTCVIRAECESLNLTHLWKQIKQIAEYSFSNKTPFRREVLYTRK